MRAADFQGSPPNGPGARRNGASHATGAVRKRAAAKLSAVARPPAEPEPDAQRLAQFAPVLTQPMDAQMWPMDPVVWLQPELGPGIPASSGLGVERQHKIPNPGLVRLEATLSCAPADPEDVCDPLKPDLHPGIPASGLVPLGWDPRVVDRRGDGRGDRRGDGRGHSTKGGDE